MDEKLDTLIAKVEGIIEKWVVDFETHLLKTSVKLVIVLYLFKWVKNKIFNTSFKPVR